MVTSGQFLLDSESKLKEAVAKMMAPDKEKNAGKEAKKTQKMEHDRDHGGNSDTEDENSFFEDMEPSEKQTGQPSEEPEDDFFKDMQ